MFSTSQDIVTSIPIVRSVWRVLLRMMRSLFRMGRKTFALTSLSICGTLLYLTMYNRLVFQNPFTAGRGREVQFNVIERDYAAKAKGYLREDTPDTSLKRLAPGVFKNFPEPFSEKFKNPCWNVTKKRPRACLPYFYLIGMPKCGTTDLWNKLSGHPQIATTGKEPHWWSRVRIGKLSRSNSRLTTDPQSYYRRWATLLRNYAVSTKRNISRLVIGDGSASTMWDNRYWRMFYPNRTNGPPHVNGELIVNIQPNARAIAILRDPTDRLYSDYLFFTNHSILSPYHFHERVKVSIARFQQCLSKYHLRTCTYNTNSIKDYVRLQVGLYSVYIDHWFSFFPRKRLKIVRMEDWHQSCPKTLTDIIKFLDVEKLHISDVFRICINDTQNTRPPDRQVLGPMLPETKTILDKFYAPYNRELAALLGDQRYLWNAEESHNDGEDY